MPSAACVIWSENGDDYKNPLILAGIESRYVRDTHKTVNIGEIRKRKQPSSFANLRLTSSQSSRDTIPMEEFERVARSDFPVVSSSSSSSSAKIDDYLSQAKVIFGKRAIALEELYGTRVQFDTPSFDAGVGIYSVNYRWIAHATHFGITKGQIEGAETPLQAITREIGEETGVKLYQSTLGDGLSELGTRDGCTFFSLKLTVKQVEIWEQTIAKRLDKHHGELFNLAFVPRERLKSHFSGKQMNQKTKTGLKLYSGSPDSPGSSGSSAHGGPASHGHAHGRTSGKGGRSRRLRSKKRVQKSKKRVRM